MQIEIHDTAMSEHFKRRVRQRVVKNFHPEKMIEAVESGRILTFRDNIVKVVVKVFSSKFLVVCGLNNGRLTCITVLNVPPEREFRSTFRFLKI